MRVGLVRHPARNVQAPEATDSPVTRAATELAALGHDVRLYEGRAGVDQSSSEATGGYLVERLDAQPARSATASRVVSQVTEFGRRLAERWSGGWRPEVVHGHFWPGGLAAATAVRQSRIPVVQTFYSIGTEQRRNLGRSDPALVERITLERALGRAVEVAVAQSPDEVDELTRLGVARSSVAMVPSGVDVHQFSPQGPAQPRTGRSKRIVSVGLEPGHGQQDLVRALRVVADTELVILGGPVRSELGQHAEAQQLTELAQRTGVANRVHLVGRVGHEEMPSWFRSADVVACTPRYVPAGATPLEAMACGVPVVGYALGGIAETVVDEVTGRLVSPGDEEALGRKLRQLLGSDVERFAYANAAVDRARCRYTWDRVAASLESVYERALIQSIR